MLILVTFLNNQPCLLLNGVKMSNKMANSVDTYTNAHKEYSDPNLQYLQMNFWRY